MSLASPSLMHFRRGAEYPLQYKSLPMTTNLTIYLQIFVTSLKSSGNTSSVKYLQYGSLYPVVMLRLCILCIRDSVLSSWYYSAFDKEFAYEFMEREIFSICSCSKLQVIPLPIRRIYLSD